MTIVGAVVLLSLFLPQFEITRSLNFGLLIGSVILMVFAQPMWKRRRIRSFPADFRKNPTLSGLLPHLADG